jgi:hypothetical protein
MHIRRGFTTTSPIHGVNDILQELTAVTYHDIFHTATLSLWFQQSVTLNLSTAIEGHLTDARNCPAHHNNHATEHDLLNGMAGNVTVRAFSTV